MREERRGEDDDEEKMENPCSQGGEEFMLTPELIYEWEEREKDEDDDG